METNRMRYEIFIRRSHGYVGRFVAGADADSYDSFSSLLYDMRNEPIPSEELKKNFYIKLGEVRAVLNAAITLYKHHKSDQISEVEDQELHDLCNELFESEGDDIMNIVDRTGATYDRIEEREL